MLPSAVAHFFLISGSEGRRSHWNSCTEGLRFRGHDVTAFGWGDLPWNGGLEAVIDFLRRHVGDAKEPVLVGHSAGGLLVPRISSCLPVRAEVYLAALAPQPGLSFAEQMFESPEEVFNPEWLASAYHPHSPEAAILRRLYDAPFSEYPEGIRLYVPCLGDREIRPEWQLWVAKRVLRANILPLEAGHYAHVTQAEEVCEGIICSLRIPDVSSSGKDLR